MYGRVAVEEPAGGQQGNPALLKDLVGVVEGSGARLGVLDLPREPTAGMKEAAVNAGAYTWDING